LKAGVSPTGWRRTLWWMLEGPRHLWSLGLIGGVIALTAVLLRESGPVGLGPPLPVGLRRVLLALTLALLAVSQALTVGRTLRRVWGGPWRGPSHPLEEVLWVLLTPAMVAGALAYAWLA